MPYKATGTSRHHQGFGNSLKAGGIRAREATAQDWSQTGAHWPASSEGVELLLLSWSLARERAPSWLTVLRPRACCWLGTPQRREGSEARSVQATSDSCAGQPPAFTVPGRIHTVNAVIPRVSGVSIENGVACPVALTYNHWPGSQEDKVSL